MSEQKKPSFAEATAGRQEIKIIDSIPGAEYANMMQVNHNQEEFTLYFMNIAGNSGKVVSKVISSPGHLKRVVAALADNIKKYEAQFGEIKIANAPEPNAKIGFEERK